MRNSTVLITGGTGFIGSHLAGRVIASGASVHLLVRSGSPTWRIAGLLPRVTFWSGDIVDPVEVMRCVHEVKPDIVFHLASDTSSRRPDPQLECLVRSVEVNLMGTLNLLRAVAQADSGPIRVVRVGGLEEYGAGPVPSDEDQRERPASPYSASQVATTHYCQMLQSRLSATVVTLRPALVYGPAQSDDFLIPALIRACLDGRDFTLTSGDHGRDLLFVEDVVAALLRAAVAPGLAGQIINVGSGREYLMRDVAQLVVRLTGASIRLNPGPSAPRFADLPHLSVSIDRAKRLLEWTPATSLEEGLSRTIVWYRTRRGGAQRGTTNS